MLEIPYLKEVLIINGFVKDSLKNKYGQYKIDLWGFFPLLKQSLMKAVHEMSLLLHLLDHFFLVFALLLSHLLGLGFPLQDLLAVLVQL